MSETRRAVSVEIVYDGDNCAGCPFLRDDGNSYNVDWTCTRLNTALNVDDKERAVRCDECKAEDAREVVPERPFTPEQEAAFLTIKSEIDERVRTMRMSPRERDLILKERAARVATSKSLGYDVSKYLAAYAERDESKHVAGLNLPPGEPSE